MFRQELPDYQAQLAQEARQSNLGNKSSSRVFATYDVVETSYHFLSNQIVLHLCDDQGCEFFNIFYKCSVTKLTNFLVGRSSHPNLKDGGALQISVRRFQVDYYPYHLAKGN